MPEATDIKGVDFHQASRPHSFDLPEEARLPDGSVVSGAKARVFELLRQALANGHQFSIGRHLAPPGWVPTWVIREPWAGGAAGDRRLRDLREDGVAIDGQPFKDGDEIEAKTWIWRLGNAATTIRTSSQAREAAPSSPSPPALPLSGLTFSGGHGPAPPGMDVLDLRNPGNPLWPAPHLVNNTEEYRAHLRLLYRDGTLQEGLRGLTRVFFLIDNRDELAPVLFQALAALGAQKL